MNAAIEQMLRQYQPKNMYERKNAMKEIVQEIVLCGLSRGAFFDTPPFTAERYSVFSTDWTASRRTWLSH